VGALSKLDKGIPLISSNRFDDCIETVFAVGGVVNFTNAACWLFVHLFVG